MPPLLDQYPLHQASLTHFKSNKISWPQTNKSQEAADRGICPARRPEALQCAWFPHNFCRNTRTLQFLEREDAKNLTTSKTKPCCNNHENRKEDSKPLLVLESAAICTFLLPPTPVFYFQCKDFYPDLLPLGWPGTSSTLSHTTSQTHG